MKRVSGQRVHRGVVGERQREWIGSYGEVLVDVELDLFARQGTHSIIRRSKRSAIVASVMWEEEW